MNRSMGHWLAILLLIHEAQLFAGQEACTPGTLRTDSTPTACTTS